MSLETVHFLVALLTIVVPLLCVSIYFNIKFAMTILRFEDTVEECLDVIDERYRSISKVLEIPIFFDSVEVRQVVNDISATRDAILIIANNLSNGVSEDPEAEAKGEI